MRIRRGENRTIDWGAGGVESAVAFRAGNGMDTGCENGNSFCADPEDVK